MRILALIPARGGSKRLPGKNIRKLGGKPLIVWSIDVAYGITEICDLLISTDDPSIAEVCKSAGAFVPWLRPAKLATDKASTVEVALHALDWYESEKGDVDGLLLLQPTSPFRTKDLLKHGINLFEINNRKPVLGVSPALSHPAWTFKIYNGGLITYMQANNSFNLRSQDLPPAYVINGSFYLISPTDLRSSKSFLGKGNGVPLLVNEPQHALDIDTQFDFDMAECVLLKNMLQMSNGQLV